MKVKRLRLRELMDEKSEREDRKISIREVARGAGVPHTTLLGYLEGERHREPHYSLVVKLCQYFGCSQEDLVEWEEEEPQLLAV